MRFEVPDVRDVVTRMLKVEASFEQKQQKISQWLEEHRSTIERNKQLVSADKHMQVLCNFMPNLLVRGMRGEAGNKVYEELGKHIEQEADLRTDVYQGALQNAGYRWGIQIGAEVIEDVVQIFRDKYRWDWKQYFGEAEAKKETNFCCDKLLAVKYIGFKVRDLALSSFNENYVAIDQNLVRVITRLGFLNYGFELLGDDHLEMGTDGSNEKNYLFLHRLILKLSALTDRKYSPSDLDRIFWYFGRSLCKVKQPKCDACPVVETCPTGQSWTNKL
jgi:endonuclease III